MLNKKGILRFLLICLCIVLAAGCIGTAVLKTSAKSVLQVNDASSSASLKNGVIQVSLSSNDVFTYNEILDLSMATKNVPLLNMQFNPAVIGVADATNVKIPTISILMRYWISAAVMMLL